MFGSIMFFHSYFRVPLIIEVWHKDNMAGNVLIGVSSASLATVLAADKVQVLSQVKKLCYLIHVLCQVTRWEVPISWLVF